ncbi:MAG: YifB family Mg chelatase-like AAA ATPase [Aquificae bacterium]|nr:YifB family Mg chelatase-like AAA ATPase [Aquificota bacterium]
MSFVKFISGGYIGLEVFPVEVQVDVSNGLPFFNIVGLADTAIKEAKERVRSALKNSGFNLPSKRITVNLAPSDRKKFGSIYDLPIALGILSTGGKINLEQFQDWVFIGELSLDGRIKSPRGVLAVVLGLREKGYKKFFVPQDSISQLEPIKDIEVFTTPSLEEIIKGNLKRVENKNLSPNEGVYSLDFSDVKGQKQVKRVLEIAAAGFHHVAMVGTPGSGKSMLAKRLPSIMPPMTEEEILEVSKIYSVAGLLEDGLITSRPYRSPHYTASETAIIGGGNYPMPGEISLAHRGVFFTDELPEFNRKVLEVLRQPLEDGEVLISRANYKVKYPARFLWVSALNPCPCGNYKHPFKECVCKPSQIRKYLRKISSPLWERIDLKVWVNPLEQKELLKETKEEASSQIRERVLRAVSIQRKRNPNQTLNGQLSTSQLKEVINLENSAKGFLEKILQNLKLSARSFHKLLKVARTIADLDGEREIKTKHLSEAVLYIREPLEVV